MWKKIVTSFFALIVIFSFSTVGYGAAMNKTDKYQVNVPKEESLTTNVKVTLISGMAPKGTNVVVEVYGTTDLTGKNFNLTNLPKKDDYILISSETIKSGELGFAKEVDLVMGINKIVIVFQVEGISSEEKIIYVYDKASAEEAARNLNLLGPSGK